MHDPIIFRVFKKYVLFLQLNSSLFFFQIITYGNSIVSSKLSNIPSLNRPKFNKVLMTINACCMGFCEWTTLLAAPIHEQTSRRQKKLINTECALWIMCKLKLVCIVVRISVSAFLEWMSESATLKNRWWWKGREDLFKFIF